MEKVIEMFKSVAKYLSKNFTECQNFKITLLNKHSFKSHIRL